MSTRGAGGAAFGLPVLVLLEWRWEDQSFFLRVQSSEAITMNYRKSLSVVLLGACAAVCAEAPSQGEKAPPKRKAVRAMTMGLAGGSRKPPTQDELKQRLTQKPYPKPEAGPLGHPEVFQVGERTF